MSNTPKKCLIVRIDEKQHERMQEHAKSIGLSVNAYIVSSAIVRLNNETGGKIEKRQLTFAAMIV